MKWLIKLMKNITVKVSIIHLYTNCWTVNYLNVHHVKVLPAMFHQQATSFHLNYAFLNQRQLSSSYLTWPCLHKLNIADTQRELSLLWDLYSVRGQLWKVIKCNGINILSISLLEGVNISKSSMLWLCHGKLLEGVKSLTFPLANTFLL